MATAQDVTDYLAARTVTPEEIANFNLEIMATAELAARLNLEGSYDVPGGLGLYLPGPDGYGHGIFFKGGHMTPSTSGFLSQFAGQEVIAPLSTKKINTRGKQDIVLLPPMGDWSRINEVPTGVAFAESYIKGIVLTRLNLHVVVLNGVYGFRSEAGTIKRLINYDWPPDINVLIAFDSLNKVNERSARNVARAKRWLAGVLQFRYGVQARDLGLPPPDDEREDWGVDDFVAANGLDALLALADASEPLEGMDEAQEAIEDYNDRFALISETARIVQLTPPYHRFSRADFVTVFGNRSVTVVHQRPGGEPTTRRAKVAELWLASPDRRTLERMAWLPGQDQVSNDRFYNMWRGWPVEPDLSDEAFERTERLFADTIREAVPDGHQWLLQAIASIVQNPGTRTAWYLYLMGEKGTGKGFLTGALRAMFGEHHAPSVTVEGYCNKFNSVKACARLLMIDEIPERLGKELAAVMEAELKLDADPNAHTRMLEYKGRDVVQQERNSTVIISGNYLPIWDIPWGDRRAACFKFIDEMAINDEMRPWGTKSIQYWEERFAWRNTPEGAADLLGWAMRYDTSGFEMHAAPIATELKRSIVETRLDFRGFAENLKANPKEAMVFMGQDVFDCRFLTIEQIAHLYHQEEHGVEITMAMKSRYAKTLKALGFMDFKAQKRDGGKNYSYRGITVHGPAVTNDQALRSLTKMNNIISSCLGRSEKY